MHLNTRALVSIIILTLVVSCGEKSDSSDAPPAAADDTPDEVVSDTQPDESTAANPAPAEPQSPTPSTPKESTPDYETSNLRGDWDAQFASGSAPGTGSSWKDLSGISDGTLNSMTHASWDGNGTTASPYALALDGSGNVDFGSASLAGQSKMLVTAWVKSGTGSSTDSVIIGNSANATGNGFTIKQLPNLGPIEFVIGRTYRDVILADAPIGYWRLDEASGTTAKDSSGNSHDGTYSNTPSLNQTGAIQNDNNKAVVFDSSSTESVSIGNMGSMPMAGAVEFWLKTPAHANYPNAFSTHNSSNRGIRYEMWSDGQFRVAIGDDNANPTETALTNSIAVNTWHHVVTTWDRAQNKTWSYLDGTAVINGASQTLWPTTLPNVTIGAGWDTRYWDGAIDEVAMYATNLTSAQVAAHYNAGLAAYGGSCQSSTSPANGWNFVAGIFSGSTAKLYINGTEECSVSVSNGFTTPATNLIAGATAANTKNFTGSIGDLKIYATSDGSAAGTAAIAEKNFEVTAGRFGVTP